ncbi:MAG: diacylglycerol kinase family lipid kinase, partial [Mycolicibacterium sp.]|nr:diacylglycerol kinase family lipid kinase [Mycolicibacterium sp.]
MRAVLIVNPNATSTTAAARDLLAHALESRVKLTVEHTDARGHAIEIAREAARDAVDVVIVHGGDGTVNEVVNGVLGAPGAAFRGRAPAVGVVPGGSANVFARSLGISPDPVEATNQLVDLLGEHRRDRCWRRIGLMDCGERWALFTAGMGVDGEVAAAVETQRNKGRRVTSVRYIRTTVPLVLRSARRQPRLTLQLPGREPVEGVHFVFVSNANPWTYANTRPVWTNPGTTYETGLGVFATTSMNVWANLRLVRQMLAKRPRLQARHLIRHDDLPW